MEDDGVQGADEVEVMPVKTMEFALGADEVEVMPMKMMAFRAPTRSWRTTKCKSAHLHEARDRSRTAA